MGSWESTDLLSGDGALEDGELAIDFVVALVGVAGLVVHAVGLVAAREQGGTIHG